MPFHPFAGRTCSIQPSQAGLRALASPIRSLYPLRQHPFRRLRTGSEEAALNPKSSDKSERVGEPHGLRALANLSVVAWLYLGIGDPGSIPARIFMVGRSGVDLFFVLSGYLITGILLANAN